jgi:hypothetical protein
MSMLSIVHVLLGLMAVSLGLLILGLRKGDPRHRVLGWLYLGCILMSLTAIIVGGLSHPTPFHGYAAVVMGALMAGVLASRFRSRLPDWRSWHAALMSFSMLGAAVAIGGVVGAVALGVGKGPAYYRMFNVVIVCFTALGLWIINTRSVIWGPWYGPRRRPRLWFGGFVVAISIALILAQWALFLQ